MSVVGKQASVVYDFSGQTNDGELTLFVGDTVRILEDATNANGDHSDTADAGWYRVQVIESTSNPSMNATEGYFPSNYLGFDQQTAPVPGPAPTTTITTAASPHISDHIAVQSYDSKSPLHHIKRNSTHTGVAATTTTTAATAAAVSMKELTKSHSSTRFGVWASNMAIATAFSLAICAVGIFEWAIADSDEYGTTKDALIGVYSLLLAGGIVLYEYFWGYRQRSPSMIPARGIAYLLLSIPTMFTIPTMFGGMLLIVTACVEFVATYNRETLDEPRSKAQVKQMPRAPQVRGAASLSVTENTMNGAGAGASVASVSEPSCIEKLTIWIFGRKEESRVGRAVFLILYSIANLIIFWVVFADWYEELDKPSAKFSKYVAWAKGHGACMDFNFTLMLIPVSKTFIRWFYNHSTSDQTVSSRVLRGVLWLVPLDQAIEFHMLMGWVSLLHAWGHTVAHLFNYVLEPGNVWDKFGIGIWITGALLFIIMLLMYTSVLKNVKRYHFEIFWYAHHLFIPFYLCCLTHGAGGWGPNFWKWLLLPGFLYIIERLYREYMKNQPVTLLSVTHMDPNVYCLEFGKSGPFATPFKEGQYVFLQCPWVSTSEWHPFTISSAPQEDSVTLHIQSMGSSSWTGRVQDFMRMMGQRDASYCDFERLEGSATVRGKIMGPDGRPLFRIYGPHSAPTQHLPEYDNVMVATSGIGVTPLSAAMSSVVHHRWKFFMGRCYPDRAVFYWVVSYKVVDSFKWFMRVVKECCDEVVDMRIKNKDHMASKHFELHIFVTSIPKDHDTGTGTGTGTVRLQMNRHTDHKNNNNDDDVGVWGLHRSRRFGHGNQGGMQDAEQEQAPFTEADLYNAIKSGQDCQLGDVSVHAGRPNWQEQFEHYVQVVPQGDVGIMFCGNAGIAADLKRFSIAFSSAAQGRFFKLHEEKF
jgi:Ferric reductase NAD binding domain/Ferric reductase like transmembrane component/FAD-binding domain